MDDTREVIDENGRIVSPLDDDYEYFKEAQISPLDDDWNKYEED